MKCLESVGLADVQHVYSGPEGRLWELVMGEQVHIGGFASSMDLADRAGVGEGTRGVDLCCCTGAGMRFLVQHRKVASMHGVDATPEVVAEGKKRCRRLGFGRKIRFTVSEATRTPLPEARADFVWGEDAWCYVADKPALVREAVRLVRKGGVIAFTDWVEGPGMSDDDARRYLKFMKFPNILTAGEYVELLKSSGCSIDVSGDTGRFAAHVDLYMRMLQMQLTGDALRILGGSAQVLGQMAAEMEFVRQLASGGKVQQAIFVARKN